MAQDFSVDFRSSVVGFLFGFGRILKGKMLKATEKLKFGQK